MVVMEATVGWSLSSRGKKRDIGRTGGGAGTPYVSSLLSALMPGRFASC